MLGFDLSKYAFHGTFIETGTERGGGVRRALEAGFERVITIELAHNFYRNNLLEFGNDPRVTMIYGDSTEMLSYVCRLLPPTSCLFWLDAHVDNGYVKNHKVLCPLFQELDILAKNNRRKDTILIDDKRKFTNDGDWGSNITEKMVVDKLKQLNSEYVIYYENGIEVDDIIGAKLP